MTMTNPTVLINPLFVAEMDGDNTKFHIHVEHRPIELFGIAISDLIDHIADAYHQTTGRDKRDIRASIVKVLRDEDRFKEKDPKRTQMSGKIVGRVMQ
jgi:hypothetical protein